MVSNHPSWLPKQSIVPVYITIALAVLALLYWLYQAIFGADERAAREAEEQLSERSRTLCTQAPPPGVREIMGNAAGRPNGPAGCIWGPNPENELYLRHGTSTLDRYLKSAGPDGTLASANGNTIYIRDMPLYCVAAFDDRLGHYFEPNLTKNNDPACTRVGPAAGELADLIVK